MTLTPTAASTVSYNGLNFLVRGPRVICNGRYVAKAVATEVLAAMNASAKPKRSRKVLADKAVAAKVDGKAVVFADAAGLTPASKALLVAIINDTGNWSAGSDAHIVWGCNVGGAKSDAGNLTHLKKLGFVRSEDCNDEINGRKVITVTVFPTAAGFAAIQKG